MRDEGYGNSVDRLLKGKDIMKKQMSEKDCMKAINEEGESAYSLLLDANPNLEKRFDKLAKEIVDYLKLVKKYFPDACYYTASGGFNLMLGNPHDEHLQAQSELIALSGKGVEIGDGDF